MGAASVFRAIAGVLAGFALGLPPAAANPVDDLIEGWYAVEAIVFQRTDASASDTPEQLVEMAPRSAPSAIRSFDNESDESAYDLDPLALATLEFATLSYDCAAAGGVQPYRPTGVPARYRPEFPNSGARPGDPIVAMQPEAWSTVSGSSETPVSGPPPEGVSIDDCMTRAPGIRGPAGPGSNPGRRDAPGRGGARSEFCALDIPLAPDPSLPFCRLAPGMPPPPVEPILEPHPLLDWLSASRRFESALEGRSYRAGTDGAMLRREANRIRNSADLRLLWHGRWIQPVPPRNLPEPLLVQAGRQADGVHELEGAFAVTLGRYLHFHARLWWTGAPVAVAVHTGNPDTVPQPPPEKNAHMVLDENRVMRSGTLHYLDHPVLGVLVRADAVEPPTWLLDALAALEAAEGGN